jgi:hypothetical protein
VYVLKFVFGIFEFDFEAANCHYHNHLIWYPFLILTSCLTGLDWSVLQIRTNIVSCQIVHSKPVKQEVNGTVILPPFVFPVPTIERPNQIPFHQTQSWVLSSIYANDVTLNVVAFKRVVPFPF